MSVRIKDNTMTIINSKTVKSSIFLRQMSDEIVRIATPNTPKDTGRLRADIVKQITGTKGKIKWGKRYAVYQETKQYANYTTPGTGPHFAENAVKESVRSINKIARMSGLI